MRSGFSKILKRVIRIVWREIELSKLEVMNLLKSTKVISGKLLPRGRAETIGRNQNTER